MSGDSLHVRVEPHGRLISVCRDQSVLEAALAAGLNLPHSCKSGHCASCVAKLHAGEIWYPHGRPLGLNSQDEAAGRVLLCQARALTGLTIEARGVSTAGSIDIKSLPCRIARMQPLARDVMQVFLRLPAVEPLIFEPGQYVDLILEGGQRRSFSIASPPHDAAEIELHVRRVAGGAFTERLFDSMRPGALLRLEGPIGQFIYSDSGAPLVLIAGGTGFAPIKSILRHVLERVHARSVRFYWGARTAADVYEAALVRRWQAQHPRLEFIPVLSEATAHDCRCGLVTDIALREETALSQSETYAAGPPQMIEALRAGFQQRGIAAERLRFDSFDYAPA